MSSGAVFPFVRLVAQESAAARPVVGLHGHPPAGPHNLVGSAELATKRSHSSGIGGGTSSLGSAWAACGRLAPPSLLRNRRHAEPWVSMAALCLARTFSGSGRRAP